MIRFDIVIVLGVENRFVCVFVKALAGPDPCRVPGEPGESPGESPEPRGEPRGGPH